MAFTLGETVKVQTRAWETTGLIVLESGGVLYVRGESMLYPCYPSELSAVATSKGASESPTGDTGESGTDADTATDVPKRTRKRKATAPKDTSTEVPKGKTTATATRTVHRKLDTEYQDYRGVWESLMSADTTLENFTTAAKAYLGDKTELKETTIESADYEEIYKHYQHILSKD